MPRRKQDSRQATTMPKRRPEDGLIDWCWPASRIHNWVRALTHPYPGAFAYLAGRKITIWKSKLAEESQIDGATIGSIYVGPDGFPAVVTGDGMLKLIQVEREDEFPISGDEAAKTFLQTSAVFHTARSQVAE
jgi:methionyl-tRNA formyltransferase